MSEFANNESAFEALLESIKQASNNIKEMRVRALKR